MAGGFSAWTNDDDDDDNGEKKEKRCGEGEEERRTDRKRVSRRVNSTGMERSGFLMIMSLEFRFYILIVAVDVSSGKMCARDYGCCLVWFM